MSVTIQKKIAKERKKKKGNVNTKNKPKEGVYVLNEHQAHLNGLLGHEIKVTYPGPHTIEGLLVVIKEDYLVIQNKTGLLHNIKLDHIKELTKNTKDIEPYDLSGIEFVDMPNFHELLKTFENEWLIISRDGSGPIQGFLSNVHRLYITLVVNEEISLIPTSQIATSSESLVMDSNQDQTNKKNSDNNSEQRKESHKKEQAKDNKSNRSKKEKSRKKQKENKAPQRKKSTGKYRYNSKNKNRRNDKEEPQKRRKKQRTSKNNNVQKELTPQQVMRNRRKARERKKALELKNKAG